MEFIYKAFYPNRFGTHLWKKDTACIRGSWIEGVYMKHQKVMNCPIGAVDVEREDDYEHILFVEGLADWNMPITIEQKKIIPESLCLKLPFITVNKKAVYTNDILRFKYVDNEMEYIGVGVVKYSQGRVYLDIGYLIEYNNILPIEKLGNVLENPDYKFNRFLKRTSFSGTIVEHHFDSIPYTEYLIIQDKMGKTWKFGGLDLSDGRDKIWNEHLIRMFGQERFYRQGLLGVVVNVYLEDDKPVAICNCCNGLKIMDLRNIFDIE